MAERPNRWYSILLVDDSEDDRMILRLALRNHARLRIAAEVCDGRDAIAYLGGQGDFSDRERYPFPDLMLLDLKMPHVTGYDVLKWLQTQSLDDLTVVILSGSSLKEDIARCVDLGADAYHVKTALKEPQEKMIREIERLLDARQKVS